MQSKIKLYYLCLQATCQGQASYSHVHEILSGLRRRCINARLFEPVHANSLNQSNIFSRLQGFISTQVRLISADKPDFVYIRWHFATILASIWARIRNIPVIQEVNGPYEDLFLSYPWTRKFHSFFVFMMRQQLKWSDAVIAVTPNLVQWSRQECGHDSVFLVSNGANIDIFRADASHFSLLNLPEKYVIFFGALSPWQGVDVMLKAIKSHKWPCGVALVSVGDGADKSKVIKTSKSSDKLHYLLTVDQHNLAGLVASSLGSVIPKTGEWATTGLLPLKLFESLACSVPVVVSDWPGMADFVREHQCGLVVPPGDPEALALAVAELVSAPDEAKMMGRRGAEAVRSGHSWDAKAEETFHIIYDVISHYPKKTFP